MPDDTDAVIAANARFYRALGNADLAAMSAVWLQHEDASCIHPGWLMLVGWNLIRESWQAIFQNQGPIRVWPGEIGVHLEGETAWITCVENIDASRELTDVLVQAQATNIFRRVDGQWKLVHHHASSLPSRGGLSGGQGISPN